MASVKHKLIKFEIFYIIENYKKYNIIDGPTKYTAVYVTYEAKIKGSEKEPLSAKEQGIESCLVCCLHLYFL